MERANVFRVTRKSKLKFYRYAGKKGDERFDPFDPPRRWANKQRGRGTYENDRPLVPGVIGRESGEVRLRVVFHTKASTLKKQVRCPYKMSLLFLQLFQSGLQLRLNLPEFPLISQIF